MSHLRSTSFWAGAASAILFFATAVWLSACTPSARPIEKENNAGVNHQYDPPVITKGVELSAIDVIAIDKDGCKVKRFEDDGVSHYYVVCSHAVATTTRQVSCGKHCVRPEEIPTVNAETENPMGDN